MINPSASSSESSPSLSKSGSRSSSIYIEGFLLSLIYGKAELMLKLADKFYCGDSINSLVSVFPRLYELVFRSNYESSYVKSNPVDTSLEPSDF